MSLPLDDIVNVTVNLPVTTTSGRQFNLPLIVGNVTAFNDRIKIYSSTDEMLEDGFLTSDRLYQAAVLLFGQEEKPSKIAVGRIGTVTEPNTTGEDEILLADALELNENAEVGKYIYQSEGAYLISDTQVEGSQLIISDTVTRNETITEYLTACRQANDEWYCVSVCSAITDSEIIAGAQYCESCSPSALFCFTTNEANALTSNPNIFASLKALGLRRCFGQYSTQHLDAVCAIIGWVMGIITKNVSFTLAYKPEVGVSVEANISKTGFNQLNSNNGNIYDQRGSYNIFEQGKMADGSYFDEVIQLDKYQLEMQNAIMDLLTTNTKIAQTEDGMTLLISTINKICNNMFNAGFIAGGVWQGKKILNLETGDSIPNGYLVQAESIDSQSQADREARKAPPIYVALKLAGAIHYVTIIIDVNR